MFDTKFYKNRWRPLNFRRIWLFYFFFIMTSNYKNSMYPRSFLCEEAKIKQRTPLKKELCEIGEKAIWESRFTSFFTIVTFSFTIGIITVLSLKFYSISNFSLCYFIYLYFFYSYCILYVICILCISLLYSFWPQGFTTA